MSNEMRHVNSIVESYNQRYVVECAAFSAQREGRASELYRPKAANMRLCAWRECAFYWPVGVRRADPDAGIEYDLGAWSVWSFIAES